MYIAAIGTSCEAWTVPIESIGRQYDLSRAQTQVMRRYHGFDRVARVENLAIEELLKDAVLNLSATCPEAIETVDLVLYCRTQIQVAPLNHPSPLGWLEAKYKKNIPVAAITMAHCGSPLIAIQVSQYLLQQRDYRSVLLVMGERCPTAFQGLIQGVSILGERGCAVLLKRQWQSNRLVAIQTRQLGEYAQIDWNHPADIEMNRFQNLYAETLSHLLKQTVASAALALEDIAAILPHNVNVSSWKAVAKELGLPLEKIFLENVGRFGHCFGADPFLNMQSAQALGVLKKGDYFLLVTVGLGVTLSAAVLQY